MEGYAPILYHDATMNPPEDNDFYSTLLDPGTVKPTNLFCRLSDSLFFHLDKNCPVNQDTGFIETEKIIWCSEQLTNFKIAPLLDVRWLYYQARIPYSLNQNREAVLDRRGFLHYMVCDLRANPDASYEDWNRILNTHKLVDPLTGTHFPTPIPRYIFPASMDGEMKQAFDEWTARYTEKIKFRRESQSSPASVQVNAQASQEELAHRMRLEQIRHETSMAIINNIGPV